MTSMMETSVLRGQYFFLHPHGAWLQHPSTADDMDSKQAIEDNS